MKLSKIIRKYILCPFLALSIAAQAAPVSFGGGPTPVYAETRDFTDVPSDHWAYSYVIKLRDLNITDGVGNNRFGMGQTISRAEFATFLCKLMQWQPVSPQSGSFTDNQDTSAWYYSYVEAALQHGAIPAGLAAFRPADNITREEMAVMLVNALGYGELASRLSYLGSPFTDVTQQTGAITIAKDLGIITGTGGNQFAPQATASREQAAAMLCRMYDGLHRNATDKNAFYAINSASQIDAIADFSSLCFGWGRLNVNGGTGTVTVNTTTQDGNEFYLPPGYADPYSLAAGKTRMLMLAADDATAAAILADEGLKQSTVQAMISAAKGLPGQDANTPPFDGIVVDFEGLKGNGARQSLNGFLSALRSQLDENGLSLYVMVQPQRRQGIAYYDGYDYKTIGQLADKVILMAHDYNAKQLTADEMEQGIVMTPVAPIDEVYYALRAITDPNTGVQDKSKILLQLSFDTAQWKSQNGKVIHQTPYSPSYDAILARMASGSGVHLKYSKALESPYITFFNNDDQTDNVVWYEDTRSVSAKIKLAKLFGITGFSAWRLGNIPNGAGGYNINVLDTLAGM